MKSVVFAALALVLLPVAAIAADSDDGEPKKEKKICRSEKVTGSLTRVTRVCMTEAEWKQMADATKQDMDKLQRGAAGGTAVANNPGPGGL